MVPGERLDHLKASRDEALLEMIVVHRGKGMKMKGRLLKNYDDESNLRMHASDLREPDEKAIKR